VQIEVVGIFGISVILVYEHFDYLVLASRIQNEKDNCRRVDCPFGFWRHTECEG
jgi:hypothetical protein